MYIEYWWCGILTVVWQQQFISGYRCDGIEGEVDPAEQLRLLSHPRSICKRWTGHNVNISISLYKWPCPFPSVACFVLNDQDSTAWLHMMTMSVGGLREQRISRDVGGRRLSPKVQAYSKPRQVLFEKVHDWWASNTSQDKKACLNSTLSVLHFPTLQSSRCSRVTLLRSSLKLGGEKICMNLDWKGMNGWQLVTKIPFNHKKNCNLDLRSKFVFSLSASELGVRSDILPFPPGTVLQIPHLLSCVFKMCFHESKRRPSHLLFLNPVPAFLDTFPPDILHLLSSTLKPETMHSMPCHSWWWWSSSSSKESTLS